MSRHPFLEPFLGLTLAFGLSGCETAGGDVRQWAPADHEGESKGGRQVTGSAAPGEEDATLIAVTWRQNCARCHGPTGRGDGPEGRMLKVADLARPDFQNRASDADIAKVIRKGRNKMPAFETLPEKVVEGLVKHVRRLGGR
jgi:mono/diheme cytochrome c family protein